jgi:aerobic-type carbon monoxide dehydrogenase small subunit (CoxS/CutS family)
MVFDLFESDMQQLADSSAETLNRRQFINDAYVSNICRCGTYPRVRAAIHRASDANST